MGGFPEKPGSENNNFFLKKIDQKSVTRDQIILNPKNSILFLDNELICDTRIIKNKSAEIFTLVTKLMKGQIFL
jgi:hypothetical protein